MSNRAHRTASRLDKRREQRAAAAVRQRVLTIGGMIVAAVICGVVLTVAIAGGDGGGDNGDSPELAFNGPSLPAFGGAGTDAAIGVKAPVFVTEDLDGNRAVIGGGGGPNDTAKVILFAAHWCPTCQAEIPGWADWLRANPAPDGVEVLMVSTFPDSSRDNHPPDAWFDGVGWPQPVLTDSAEGEILAAFGMGGVPGVVVLDDTNFVLTRGSGPLSEAQLSALVSLAAAS